MKKTYYKLSITGITVALLLMLASCNSWLDKPPLTQYVDSPSYWKNETAVRLFTNGFYSLFNGAGTGVISSIFNDTGTGSDADLFFATFSDDQSNVPTNNFDMFPQNATASSNTWSTPYSYIRLAELLLLRIKSVPNLTDAQRNHYTGLGYFFLAMEYYKLVSRFGDVPFINQYVDQSDTAMIWSPRMPRNQVMDSVLTYLNNAVVMIYPKSVSDADPNLGVNTVNQDCTNLLKSRICLYEGTWAKYHENNMPRAAQYFTECKNASEAVMNSGNYKLNTDYKWVYSTVGLNTSKGGEVLLYRKYQSGSLNNAIYTWANSTTGCPGLTKDAVESFLCTDGLPIGLSSLYKGDACNATNLSIAATTLANRDKRLTETVDGTLSCGGGITTNPSKFVSTTGYMIIRFNPPASASSTTNAIIDAPVFWYPEVLLNEAEALTELGSFTQADADKTVNLLRARAGVAPLQVASVPDDPKRDKDVSPLLWEVRRERRVELMLTVFRYWDLRRWGKVEYLDPKVKPDIFKGAKLQPSFYALFNKVQGGVDANGYINIYKPETAAMRVVIDPKHYLDPIPTDQVQLYQNKGINFPQNPGW